MQLLLEFLNTPPLFVGLFLFVLAFSVGQVFVPRVGVEPTRGLRPHGILSPARLPIPPPRLIIGKVCIFYQIKAILERQGLLQSCLKDKIPSVSLVDERVKKQAEIIVDYSLKVKKGENVLIIADFTAKPLVLELYKKLIQKGAGEIRYKFGSYEFAEAFFKNASKKQIETFPQISMDEMKKIDCYIRISGTDNTRGLTGIDATLMSQRAKVTRPITDYRVENTRWVVTEFPTDAQAQEADMSLDDYEDFVFSAINDVDWKKKYKEQEKLRKIIDEAETVRIVGHDTDLSLSIKGRKAVNAGGSHNMPDGEVFTSVVEDSAEGKISYTYPAVYMGREFHNVVLEFEKGEVVKAFADKGGEDLNKILDMDEGARRIGELGMGNNFQIDRFVKRTLFDEKIGGSVHVALGKGYKETKSKNVSALHWDMIKDLRKGGELWFDDRLVQKDGKWLIKL